MTLYCGHVTLVVIGNYIGSHVTLLWSCMLQTWRVLRAASMSVTVLSVVVLATGIELGVWAWESFTWNCVCVCVLCVCCVCVCGYNPERATFTMTL